MLEISNGSDRPKNHIDHRFGSVWGGNEGFGPYIHLSFDVFLGLKVMIIADLLSKLTVMCRLNE